MLKEDWDSYIQRKRKVKSIVESIFPNEEDSNDLVQFLNDWDRQDEENERN